MNDYERRRYEMQVRVAQFGVDNTTDFTGFAKDTFEDLSDIVGEIETMGGSQQAEFGEAGQQFTLKDTARENLRDLMSAISRTSKSMEYVYNGISELFHFQRNMTDVDMLNRARAFITEANTWEDQFKDFGLPNSWVGDLTNAADAFEATFDSTATAVAEQVASTADLGSKIREGMVKVRTLDAIVQNKYADNPGKLAAWMSAKHVEKAPKSQQATP